jgi:hypothetical protein
MMLQIVRRTWLFVLGLGLLAPPMAQADLSYKTNADGLTATITGYSGTIVVATIPDATNNLTVTGIGDQAFSWCSTMTNVTIPGSVATIRYGAFSSCFTLTNVTISNGVISIGMSAFYNCPRLASVTIPGSVTSIGGGAFQSCPDLACVTIPGSVTNIGNYAFANCYSLANVTISNGVPGIGWGAFQSCPNLASVLFTSNAPTADSTVFTSDTNSTVYYLSGTTGWSNTFAGRPAMLWNPQIQVGCAGFGLQTNHFGFNITGPTNFAVVVQACTNLAGGIWTPIQTNTLANGCFYFCEPALTNNLGRFYRFVTQ